MSNKLKRNIFASLSDRFIVIALQFAATILMTRFLPRSSFGILGVVVGVFTFIHIINISIEAIIWRDHKKMGLDIVAYLNSFISFNILKSIMFFIIGAVTCLILTLTYDDLRFIPAIISVTFIWSADALTSTLSIYATSTYKHNIITKINAIRWIFNAILLLGLILFPSLLYIMIKDVFVMLLFCGIWFFWAPKKLEIDLWKNFKFTAPNWEHIKTAFWEYSLWTHLVGVTTSFIYKADVFFLSLFAPMSVVGNYNVAINGANIANIFPSILGQQNSVGLSNSKEETENLKTTRLFLILSLLSACVLLIGFWLLGPLYIKILTGENNNDIYNYMLCIVFGLLLIKSVASPLVAYINIKGSVKNLFWHVNLPMLVVAGTIYYLSARYYGVMGLAISNIVNSALWCLLLSIEGYRHKLGPIKLLKLIMRSP
ncbi:MAG: lipopolysaccharide biosynthesis protein [bacterium]